MVTVNDLSTFSGNQGEDASRWLRSFVIATRGDNESAMLRMFPAYLEPASEAEVWYDGLQDDTIATWSAIERKFRQRWVPRPGGQAKSEEELNAEKFRNHQLTDDDIFGPASVDIITMNKTVVDWVEDHARLGAATALDDAALIQITTLYLPAFIRAFLRYQSSTPATFNALCNMIKEIDDRALEFEQLRRQEKELDSLRDLVETVKKLHNDINGPSLPKGAGSEQGKSDTAGQSPGVEEDSTTLFPTPEQWKRTKVSTNKAGMIEAVQDVIRTLRKYEASSVTIDASRMIDIGMLRYYNAIKTPLQFHCSSIVGQGGAKSALWQGLFQINCYQAFSQVDVTEAARTWESLSDSNDRMQRDCIYKPNHIHVTYHDKSSGSLLSANTPYYGGFAKFERVSPYLTISSFNTTLHFLLSVYLAERVTDGIDTYKQAAIDSANWVIKWAYDDETNPVKNFTWNMNVGHVWGTTSASPHVTGLFIEALCVLASVTGEQKWGSLAIKLCNTAMVYQDWHDDQGIFKYVSPSGPSVADEVNTFRGLLIRGLLAAYQRNPTNAELRHTIRSYINVQFNALREDAHYRGSYAVIWSGPFAIGETCVHAQLAALDVLMAAVIVNHC